MSPPPFPGGMHKDHKTITLWLGHNPSSAARNQIMPVRPQGIPHEIGGSIFHAKLK